MATPGIYKNFEAEGEIGPYVIVTHGTTDYAVKAATGSDRGACRHHGRTRQALERARRRLHRRHSRSGARRTVAAGDPLTSDASGKAVKATAAGNRILGFALVSGASGDIIPYQYSLGTLAVAAAG